MRRHSRWAATAATALAVAMATSLSHARPDGRVPIPPHAPAAIPPPPRPAQVPPPAKIPPAGTQTAPEVTPAPSDTPTEVPVPAAKPEPSAVVLDTRDAQAILGKSVRSVAHEDMGRLAAGVERRH